MSKAIKKTDNVVALKGLDLDEIASDAEALNPKMEQDDMAMPYVYLIQSNSPQMDKGDSKYIKAAEAGSFYSLVTNEVYDGDAGLELVNCYYERRYVEWRTRENGGGRVADYPVGHDVAREIEWTDEGKPMLPNGNLCYETAYLYVMYRTGKGDAWKMGIMPLKGTMLKTAKKMNSVIANSKLEGTTKPAPRWWFVYNVKTIRQEKDGNSWYIPEFHRGKSLREMDDAEAVILYNEAKGLAQAVKANVYEDVIKAEAEPDAVQTEAEKGQVIDNDLDDTEVPF